MNSNTFKHDCLLFSHPLNMLVIGTTSSGKSVFTRNFLTEFNLQTTLKTKPKVMWCYSLAESLKPIDNVDVITFQGLPTEDDIKENNANIVVLDDLALELARSKTASNLFTRIGHHHSVSFILITQHAFTKGLSLISHNMHVFVFMRSPRSLTQLDHFVRQTSLSRVHVLDAYTKATRKPYSYLVLDLTPASEDLLRVRSRIFRSELSAKEKSVSNTLPYVWNW